MNYSKNMKRDKQFKRIVISWIIVLLIGIFIGFLTRGITRKNDKVVPVSEVIEFRIFDNKNIKV